MSDSVQAGRGQYAPSFPSALLRGLKGRRHITVPLADLRCQDKLFNRSQGFGGKPVDEFPPCCFFQTALGDPSRAFAEFRDWMWYCLVTLRAWEVPKDEGGWCSGSLMNAIAQCHEERGRTFESFPQAEHDLVEQAIGKRVRYYLGLLDSIKVHGLEITEKSRILCRNQNATLYLDDGHHRAAALRALGYEQVEVQAYRPHSLRRRLLRPVWQRAKRIGEVLC